MPGKILHVNQDFYLNRDLTVKKLLHILTEVSVHFMETDKCNIDVTTTGGEYHYNLGFEQLYNLFLENKDATNSITLAEVTTQPDIVPCSITVYLRKDKNGHKISITIASASEEGNRIIEEFILEKIAIEREIISKATEITLTDTFHFNHRLSRRELAHIIRKIDEAIFPNLEIEVDILTKTDDLILIGEEQLSQLKDFLWQSKRKIVTIHKQSPTGSNFELNLYFEDDRSGFGMLDIESDSIKKNKNARNLITKLLDLNRRQLAAYKSSVAQRPYLQGQFEVDGTLSSDKIIDFLELLSKNFIQKEDIELKFISSAHKSYCYSEADCKILRNLFRQNRDGLLYATKTLKDLYFITICISFRSLTHVVGYYYIAMPTANDNETVFSFVKEGLLPKNRKHVHQLIEKANLQDALYFDPSISAGQLIWFLKTLHTEYIKDEITSVRISTLNGDNHYFYNEEYLEIIDIFEDNKHDTVYINKKSKDGQSITINLQFRGAPNLPNCFYSIIMNNRSKLQEVKQTIIQILKNFQEKGPHLETPQQESSPYKKCSIFLEEGATSYLESLLSLLKELGFSPETIDDQHNTQFIIEQFNSSEVLFFDISNLDARSGYLIGLARSSRKKIVLLNTARVGLPGFLKGLPTVRFASSQPDFDEIKMAIADHLIS